MNINFYDSQGGDGLFVKQSSDEENYQDEKLMRFKEHEHLV